MSSCELSPSAAAFSSVLSAFIGSVLNGLFSGFWIAFFTGWISWLSVFRIIFAGLFEFWLAIRAGSDFHSVQAQQYHSIGLSMYTGADAAAGVAPSEAMDEEARLTQAVDTVQQHLDTHYHPAVAQQFKQQKKGSYFRSVFKEPERTVSVFGWLGWTWSAVYTPISQSIWLVVHITSNDNGALLLVRALAIGVSALGLTFDYKHRYGAVLGKKWGSWAFIAFNVWNSAVCLLLGCEALALLIRGATSMSSLPMPLYIIYPIFCCLWAFVSWKMLPPIDGARPGINIFADVSMGAFAGIFCAAPAFILWQRNRFDAQVADSRSHFYGTEGSSESGMELGSFLGCQGASVLEKFAAVMP